jgi:glc operon protein GlcG
MRNRPTLTATDVQKMAAACKSEASKNKWSVSIAIVDDGGYLLYLERLDGAGPVTAEVATEKAITAARTRRPSKFWEDRLKERPAFIKFPGVLPLQGGVPVMYQNECVGAIGVSGVQSHEDEQIASAGAAALT